MRQILEALVFVGILGILTAPEPQEWPQDASAGGFMVTLPEGSMRAPVGPAPEAFSPVMEAMAAPPWAGDEERFADWDLAWLGPEPDAMPIDFFPN